MGNSNVKFTSKTTALEATDGLDLTNKVAIVTGGNTGIGKETVYALCHQGATVILACREEKRGEDAKNDIIKRIKDDKDFKGDKDKISEKIRIMSLDLSSLRTVKDFAREYLKTNLPLHYLINNAGVMAIPTFSTSVNGIEMQWGVNHVGHYYLTRLLLPKLLDSQPSRIITVSSTAHGRAPKPFARAIEDMEKSEDGPSKVDYSGWTNYGLSKASNIIFTRELTKRYKDKGITALCLHPGVIPTELTRHLSSTLKTLWSDVGKYFLKTIPQGAATTVRCVTLPDDQVHHGGYYSDCQFADNKLRADLKPKNYENWEKDSLEARLWDLTEKVLIKKGATFDIDAQDNFVEIKQEEKKKNDDEKKDDEKKDDEKKDDEKKDNEKKDDEKKDDEKKDVKKENEKTQENDLIDEEAVEREKEKIIVQAEAEAEAEAEAQAQIQEEQDNTNNDNNNDNSNDDNNEQQVQNGDAIAEN